MRLNFLQKQIDRLRKHGELDAAVTPGTRRFHSIRCKDCTCLPDPRDHCCMQIQEPISCLRVIGGSIFRKSMKVGCLKQHEHFILAHSDLEVDTPF